MIVRLAVMMLVAAFAVSAQADGAAPEDREETPEEIVSRYQGRDDLTIEEIIELGTAMGQVGPEKTPVDVLADVVGSLHTTITEREAHRQALREEIEVVLGESMDALLARMPLANRDFAPQPLVLRLLSDIVQRGPDNNPFHGLQAYDLIFSNRRMLRVLDVLEEDADPALRTQIVESIRANFEYYRDRLENPKPGMNLQSIISKEAPGTEPMLKASLLTALGLALAAAEHNITEAHPVILEMARYGLEQHRERGGLGETWGVSLYNRLILTQALAGTAVAGTEAVTVLKSLGVLVDYRKVGRADSLYTPSVTLTYGVQPYGNGATLFTPLATLPWRVPLYGKEDTSRRFLFVPVMDDDTYLRVLRHFEAAHGP